MKPLRKSGDFALIKLAKDSFTITCQGEQICKPFNKLGKDVTLGLSLNAFREECQFLLSLHLNSQIKALRHFVETTSKLQIDVYNDYTREDLVNTLIMTGIVAEKVLNELKY